MQRNEISDETLTFYYYHDGLSTAQRQIVTSALAIDDDLAERYRALSRDLDGLFNPGSVAVPQDMTERWHDTIKNAARREAPRRQERPFQLWSFALGAAVAVALVAGIGIGILVSEDPVTTPDPMTAAATADDAGSSAFLRGLRVHLRDSETRLADIGRSPSTERLALIESIVQQNRRFERAAENNQALNVARVLRAFELVLLRMAAEDASPEDIEQLRAKLLFELNIMLTKISRDTSDQPRTI